MNLISSATRHTLTNDDTPLVIYFAGSIRAGRDDVPVYAKIIKHLAKYGDVVTEHVGDYSLSVNGQSHLNDRDIHNRDLRWLRSSDIVIAEVTTPSLGVGYEIATAIAWRIPVLALYRNQPDSHAAMIASSPGVESSDYVDLEQVTALIDGALARLNGGSLS